MAELASRCAGAHAPGAQGVAGHPGRRERLSLRLANHGRHRPLRGSHLPHFRPGAPHREFGQRRPRLDSGRRNGRRRRSPARGAGDVVRPRREDGGRGGQAALPRPAPRGGVLCRLPGFQLLAPRRSRAPIISAASAASSISRRSDLLDTNGRRRGPARGRGRYSRAYEPGPRRRGRALCHGARRRRARALAHGRHRSRRAATSSSRAEAVASSFAKPIATPAGSAARSWSG